jgi:hypothetical protein
MDLSNLNFKKQGRVASRRDIKQMVIKEGKFFQSFWEGLFNLKGKAKNKTDSFRFRNEPFEKYFLI